MSDLREPHERPDTCSAAELADILDRFIALPSTEAIFKAAAKKLRAISAEPAQPKALMDADELTDEQIESALKGAGINIGLDDGTPGYRFIMMAAFNAVVAADRASRLPEIKDEQIVSAMLAGSGGDPVWMRLTNKQMIAAGRAVEALVRGKT